MKRIFSTLSIVALLALPAVAQTNDNNFLTGVENFFNNGSNWVSAVYGIYVPKLKTAGEGAAFGYKITDNIVSVLRVDCFNNLHSENGGAWLPSGQMQLQVPIHLTSATTLTFFGFGGLAVPLSGMGDANRQTTGIFGTGGDISISQHLRVIADWETWNAQQQVRFGFCWKF